VKVKKDRADALIAIWNWIAKRLNFVLSAILKSATARLAAILFQIK
jgi:hypothetical protein